MAAATNGLNAMVGSAVCDEAPVSFREDEDK